MIPCQYKSMHEFLNYVCVVCVCDLHTLHYLISRIRKCCWKHLRMVTQRLCLLFWSKEWMPMSEMRYSVHQRPHSWAYTPFCITYWSEECMRKLGRPGIKDHENDVTRIHRIRNEVATVRKLTRYTLFCKTGLVMLVPFNRCQVAMFMISCI